MFLYNMKRGACESTPFVYLLYIYCISTCLVINTLFVRKNNYPYNT